MAISDTIESMQENLSNAYDKISDKGGTLPINKNLANLEDAIDSIPSGSGNTLFKSLVNRSITTVTAEDLQGLTSIGNSAFIECRLLTDVELPETITNIVDSAFQACFALENINIPNGVTTIPSYCFYNCRALTKLIIPSGVSNIGISAFRYCLSMREITILATTPPTLASANAFENSNDCPIYVPAESVNAYKAATNWSSYANRIFAIQE